MFISTVVSESGITAVAAAHESWGWCSDTTKCQHFKHRQLFPGCLPLARCSCWFFFLCVFFFQKQLLKEANYSCVFYSYQVHSHKFHKYSTLVFTLAKGTSFQYTQLYALARSPNYYFPMSHSFGEILQRRSYCETQLSRTAVRQRRAQPQHVFE